MKKRKEKFPQLFANVPTFMVTKLNYGKICARGIKTRVYIYMRGTQTKKNKSKGRVSEESRYAYETRIYHDELVGSVLRKIANT